jgi:hypothetical protein
MNTIKHSHWDNMPFMPLLRRKSAKRALGSLILFVLTVAFLECALWVVSTKSKACRVLLSDIQPELPDPVLGIRLNPDVPEHDKAGFRNASVAESPYLVALGDSLTYSLNVGREEAWPQQLAALSGKPIYNMGVPNYGPVEELVLMSHAMTLRPQWVVVGFSCGTDLHDAFSMVYTRKQIIDLRSSDQSVISAIEKAEKESPLDQNAERFMRALTGNFDPAGTLSRAKAFLSKHSRLWGLLRAARRVVMKNTVPTVSPDVPWSEQVSLARKSGGLWVPFEKVRVRTIFTPQVRLAALKMEDPRIHEGLRVSVEAIKRMSSITQNAGVRFMVVLIPTKEHVFFDTFGGDTDGTLQAVTKLAHEEQEMLTELKNELRVNDISYIDVLPALRESLNEGESPYPIGADGHPNARGHKAIADAVWRAMTATTKVPIVGAPTL